MKETLSGLYIVFIIIALVFVFALVGYFIDQKYPDEVKLKKEEELGDDEKLKLKLAEQGNNKSLGNMLEDANKNVAGDTTAQPQPAVQTATLQAPVQENVLQPTIPTNTGNNPF